MENKFYITENDLRIYVDKNHKVTVYVMNRKKTAVKTISDLEYQYYHTDSSPSEKITDINPHTYYNKLKEIEKKHKDMRKDPKYKNYLKMVDESETEEIDVLLKPVRKALHNNNIAYVECEDDVTPSGFAWMDCYNKPVEFNFRYDEEVDCTLYNGYVLGKICTRDPKAFTTFDDLKNYEKELQVRYNKYYEKEEASRLRYDTEKLLNF